MLGRGLIVAVGCATLGCRLPGEPPSPPPGWVSPDGVSIKLDDARHLVGPERKEKIAPYPVIQAAANDAIGSNTGEKPSDLRIVIESYRLRTRGWDDPDGVERPTDAAWPILPLGSIEEDGFPVVGLGLVAVATAAVGLKEFAMSRRDAKNPDAAANRERDRLEFGANVWLRATVRFKRDGVTREKTVDVRGFGELPQTGYWGDAIRAANQDAANQLRDAIRAAAGAAGP